MTWSPSIRAEIAGTFRALSGIYERTGAELIVRGLRVLPRATGERCARSKLTAPQVIAIRAALDGGDSVRSQAEAHGVSIPTVHYIHHRITWAHLPETA